MKQQNPSILLKNQCIQTPSTEINYNPTIMQVISYNHINACESQLIDILSLLFDLSRSSIHKIDFQEMLYLTIHNNLISKCIIDNGGKAQICF
jgi:hypothetical protein